MRYAIGHHLPHIGDGADVPERITLHQDQVRQHAAFDPADRLVQKFARPARRHHQRVERRHAIFHHAPQVEVQADRGKINRRVGAGQGVPSRRQHLPFQRGQHHRAAFARHGLDPSGQLGELPVGIEGGDPGIAREAVVQPQQCSRGEQCWRPPGPGGREQIIDVMIATAQPRDGARIAVAVGRADMLHAVHAAVKRGVMIMG